MKLNISSNVVLNEDKIKNKVTNDDFGLEVAIEWLKLIGPYTPRDTGRTEDDAIAFPWEIYYNPVDPETGEHYAQKIYYGTDIKFHKIYNPYATHHWDMAAEQSGEKTELYRILNDYLHK